MNEEVGNTTQNATNTDGPTNGNVTSEVVMETKEDHEEEEEASDGDEDDDDEEDMVDSEQEDENNEENKFPSVIGLDKEEEFNKDEWELVDEDVCVMELHGLLDKQYIKNCNKDKLKLVGLMDSDKSVLQLDQYVFKGGPTTFPGSLALFKANKVGLTEVSSDEETGPNTRVPAEKRTLQFEYVGLTRNKYSMNRTFLTKKNTATDNAG